MDSAEIRKISARTLSGERIGITNKQCQLQCPDKYE